MLVSGSAFSDCVDYSLALRAQQPHQLMPQGAEYQHPQLDGQLPPQQSLPQPPQLGAVDVLDVDVVVVEEVVVIPQWGEK